MCNRYRPASITRIRDTFGFLYVEDGPEPDLRYSTTGIGPLQAGPFITRSGLSVGQWGLTPDGSASLKPISKKTGRAMSTNNARWDPVRRQPEAWTFKGPWARGQRCIVPMEDFDEPYWGTGRNIWWRFRRADGQPLGIAGIWNAWTDPESGEITPSYTVFTLQCNTHPLLRLMHRPDRGPDGKPLPDDQQDKRTIVPLEPDEWEAWLTGTPQEAAALIDLPAGNFYAHGAADPAKAVQLPL